jgi:predicted transcriptional regulator
VEDFQNLLFEISNDYRYAILVLLHKNPVRITEIAKLQHLTTQEISRHISRLVNIEMATKDTAGLFHITPYGELVLSLLEELQFTSKNKSYFAKHTVTQLPPVYIKRIGELSNSKQTSSVMEFLHFVDQVIKEAKEYVWLCVDQYPLTAIGSIVNALKRNVRFRVIESRGILNSPKYALESLEEAQALAGTRRMPLGEQKIVDKIDYFMASTESKCAIAFPTQEGHFDYFGFISSDERSRTWCNDLFKNTWSGSEKVRLRS